MKNTYTLEKIQRKAARFVCSDFKRLSSVTAMYDKLGWKELKIRRDYLNLKNVYCTAAQFGGWLSLNDHLIQPDFFSRNDHHFKFALPSVRTNICKFSFIFS